MKLIRNFVVASLGAIVLTIISTPAASAQTFDAGNIVSDSIFTNNTSMTADSIQNFIRIKNANCVDGEAPCLRNYVENGKSAGTIIKETADTYRINPQTLLVLLQKETGLVTRSQPTSWLYKIAMGYGCPDTAACDSQYYGFTNQTQKAARMFRFIMDDNPNWYTPYELGVNYIQYNPEASCGGSNVNIQNRATQALYNYTPYQPNVAALAAGFGTGNSCSAYGNRNFWLYFNTWFGTTQGTVLLQSPQSPAVYLQSGGTRYGIPTWDVINAYGLGSTAVTPVTDSYMNSLTNGGVLTTVFTNASQPGPVFMADNGHRFGFASHQQCIDWGFPSCLDSSYTKPLEPSIFDRLYDVGAIKPLMLTGSTVFWMKDGEKRPFLSGKAMTEAGYSNSDFSPITNSTNNRQPVGFALLENNSLVKFSSRDAIYYYNNSKFYTLTYPAFRTLSAEKPVVVDGYSKYTLAAPSPEYTVQPLLRTSAGKSYLLTNGSKLDITATASNWPTQLLADAIEPALNGRPVVHVTDDSTFRSASGAIFDVENGALRPFYSLKDYFAEHSSPVVVGDDVAPLLQNGSYILKPGIGSVYQVTTSGKEYAIYALSSDSTVCQITSMSQLGDFRLNTDAVKRIPELTGAVKPLSKLISDDVGNVYLIEKAKRTRMAKETLLSNWGITSYSPGCTFSSLLVNSIPASSQSFSRFMRAENGVIYYGESGQKRPIYSYAAFLRLGGNSSNTPTVPDSLLSLSPTGEPITQ